MVIDQVKISFTKNQLYEEKWLIPGLKVKEKELDSMAAQKLQGIGKLIGNAIISTLTI